MTSSRQSFNLSANYKNNQPPTSTASTSNAALTGAARAFIRAQPTGEAATENARNTISNVSPKGAPPKPAPPRPAPPPQRAQESWTTRQPAKKKPPTTLPRNDSLLPGSLGSLAVPKTRSSAQSHSPSNIAASLAASRASPSPSALSTSPPTRRPVPTASYPTGSTRNTGNKSFAKTGASSPSLKSAAVSFVSSSPERLDLTPIPPTTSLVKLFENKSPDPIKPAIHAPRALRRSSILDGAPAIAIFPADFETVGNGQRDLYVKPSMEQDDDASSVDSFTSAKELRTPSTSPVKVTRPPVPNPRRSAKDTNTVNPVLDGTIEPIIHIRPPTRNTSKPIDIKRAAPSPPPPAHSDSARQKSITALYHQMHPRRVTPLTSGDSLANAIVASSLASSRAPSPTKLPPAPAMRRKSSSISHASHSIFSRTPSPPKKGMRHTMRKADSSSSDEDEDPYGKHKKKRFVRKHPNKHHEGDRKRWRDAVTLRERKRYEGVWAANKSLHILYTPLEQELMDRQPNAKSIVRMKDAIAEQVSSIVTRDIWSRSRLPAHILEQVWDLVDTQTNGRLLKEEFVVGLWLIDQLLKGRKLPVKVSETVWNSVKFLQGIALPKRT